MSFKRGKTQIKGTLNVISALRPARTCKAPRDTQALFACVNKNISFGQNPISDRLEN